MTTTTTKRMVLQGLVNDIILNTIPFETDIFKMKGRPLYHAEPEATSEALTENAIHEISETANLDDIQIELKFN